MRQYSKLLLLLSLSLMVGCMETPEISTSKESSTREKIVHNKLEAEKAHNAYIMLQRCRE